MDKKDPCNKTTKLDSKEVLARKKYEGFEENREDLEEECYWETRQQPCEQVVRDVDSEMWKTPYINLDPDSPYIDTFVNKDKPLNFKEKFFKFLFPKDKDEKETFSNVCVEPPCNLECFHGLKVQVEDEGPDKVKGLVYTKGGALYETVAYRLPRDFASGKPKDETPYYERKVEKAKKPEIMEFTGPVKITIVKSDGFLNSYTAKRFRAAILQLGHILVGCTVMCTYFYAISFRHHYSTNVHIICCVIAFQYCLPVAHFYSNKCSITGYALSTTDVIINTFLMKTFAMLNILIGMYLIQKWKELLPGKELLLTTTHAKYGYTACAFALAEYILSFITMIFIGPDPGHVLKCYIHILSHLALAYSLISFYFGLIHHLPLKNFFKFQHWYYWVFCCAIFFTVVAILRPCMDCLYQLWTYIYGSCYFVYKKVKPRPPCTRRADAEDCCGQKKYLTNP